MGSPYLFQPVGSGSGGSGAAGINYLSAIYNGDTLTNINTYNDGASSTPTNGTGGVVAGLSTTLNTSTPLVGTSCVRFSKDASNRQGMGWAFDFTVDDISSDQSNPLNFQMYYRTSAGYVSNEVRGFLYDVTNGTLLNLNDISNNSGSIIAAPGDAQISWIGFTVQAATSYRLIWHIAGTSAVAWDMDLDCFVASPQTTQPGFMGTYLGKLTTTGSFTNATYSADYWRRGQFLVCEGTITLTNAPAAGTLTINLPSNYVIDTSVLGASVAANITPFRGKVGISDGGSRQQGGQPIYVTTTSISLQTNNSLSATGLIAHNVPITFAATDVIYFSYEVPIVGWSDSAALSTTETMFSTAKFTGTKGSAQTISATAATKVTWTASVDNCSGWDSTNNRYVAPRSGRYQVLVSWNLANASAEYFYQFIYVNGSPVRRFYNDNLANSMLQSSASLDLVKGDYVEVFSASTADTSYDIQATATNNGTYFSITEDPNFSIFSVYGQTEYLSATSATKTPTASDRYHQLTNNTLTLTPGTWRLYGSAKFTNAGGVAYAVVDVGWWGANGADTSSIPVTGLGSISGLSVVTAIDSARAETLAHGASLDNAWFSAPTVIVRCTTSVTVYIVTYATMTTAANARVIAYANAERLQ